MSIKDVLAQVEAEIARLEQARSLLADGGEPEIGRNRLNKTFKAVAPVKSVKKKRNISPEGRARIAAAVKRRWAAQKG